MRNLAPLALVVILGPSAASCGAPSTELPQDGQSNSDFHPLLVELVGDWTVTGRRRESVDAEWQDFPPSQARIESLFGGALLRERAPDHGAGEPWPEIALTSHEPGTGRFVFMHLFGRSMSVLRMTGRLSADGRTIEYEGAWHRERDGATTSEPASGRLHVEGPDAHAWQLDGQGPDGQGFVDLEFRYTRAKPGALTPP